MPVKMRLARRGRTKAPFYHIVIADARSPRDGKFIEQIGSYNPLTVPATIELDRDKAYDWLVKGAQPTDTVNAILGFKGVLMKKHLQRGVKKGAFTQEVADEKLAAWIAAKEAKIQARVDKSATDKADYNTRVSGQAKVVAKVEAAVEEQAAFRAETPASDEDQAAFRVEAAAAEVEAPAVTEAEAPAADDAPTAE
jgi:small subunit ribosomal protein S16